MLNSKNTSKEITENLPKIAVFGIGAIEQHSIHLPLGTDWLGVQDVTKRVAEKMGAFLVPALPFSMSQCHGPMSGTVWLKPITLASVLKDVVLSLYEQGIKKILVVNGHGGNFVLEAEIRRLNLKYPDLFVLFPPWFPPKPGESKIWDKGIGIHANEGETSHQLLINPNNVKTEIIDYQPPVGREYLDYAYMDKISEWGVWGFPSYGTVEKGEKAITRRVERIVDWALESFKKIAELRGGNL